MELKLSQEFTHDLDKFQILLSDAASVECEISKDIDVKSFANFVNYAIIAEKLADQDIINEVKENP